MSIKRDMFEALHRWVDHVMHDESIGFSEAMDVVIAKMHKESTQRKRQVMAYDRTTREFSVTTNYEIQHNGSVENKSLTGIPHVEVLPYGAVKVGCITFTRDAISKIHLLSFREPEYVQDGYMVKGLIKKTS